MPSAALHQTFATFFFKQPIGCWVFGSMWFISGSGHINCPTRNRLHSIFSATAKFSHNSFTRIKPIIPKQYFIVDSLQSCPRLFLFTKTHFISLIRELFTISILAALRVLYSKFYCLRNSLESFGSFDFDLRIYCWNTILSQNLICFYILFYFTVLTNAKRHTFSCIGSAFQSME